MPLPSFGRNRPSKAPSSSAHASRRHRSAPAAEEPAAEDHELSSYLAALAPEADVESTGSGRRFGDAQVYQLRLSLAASQQLKELADELGTSPQALAQEWVLNRLADEDADWPTSQAPPAPATPGVAPKATRDHRALGEAVTEELYLEPHHWPEDVHSRLG